MKNKNKIIENFRNGTSLEFKDISSEKKRVYTFPNGNKLKIKKPLLVNVRESGGHRIFTEDGICYYVQPREGWSIKWTVKPGEPHMAK